MLDRNKLYEVILDGNILGQRCIVRDGYVFTAITEPGNVYDALVIRNPYDVPCFSPRYHMSQHSLEEHIQLVNTLKLDKAVILGKDISFLPECPSLKYLSILPVNFNENGFDFSPLYQMPEIIQLHCSTQYGKQDQFYSTIDYLQISGLKRLSISGKGHLNVNKVATLQRIGISGYQGKDLTELFCSKQLEELRMIQCRNKSLAGIDRSQCIHSVELSYNRSLSDISQLTEVKDTLKTLCIRNCPKITDFTYLNQLTNLEHLQLHGKNTLPDLAFLERLPKLKSFDLDMDVADGDLTPCLAVPYVKSQKDRKHFNLKDVNLPKARL